MSRRNAWILAICAVLTNLVSHLDRSTLGIIAPSVREALHLDETDYAMLGSAFNVAYLLASPLTGRLLDRVGARRGLLVALLLWSMFSALHGLAPSFGILIMLRLGLGVAESPCLPGGAQVMVRALPERDRPRGMGMLFLGSSLGAILAAPLAGWLNREWGWQAAFLGTATAGLVWIPIWLTVAWRRDAREVLDAKTHVERRRNLPFFATLREPYVFRGVFVVLLISFPLSFHGLWGAELLVRDFHVAKTYASHYLWLPPLGIDAGAIVFGELITRRARRLGGRHDRATLVLSSLLATTGAWAAASAPEPWMAMVGLALIFFGATGVYTLMLSETTARLRGSAALVGGFITTAQSLAFIAAYLLVGVAAKRLHSYIEILLALGVLPIVAVAGSLAMARRETP